MNHTPNDHDDLKPPAPAMSTEERFRGLAAMLARVHEEEREEEQTADLVEVGLRRQFTPRLVLSAGVGAGLNDDSLDWRGTPGFQFSIGRPARKPKGETITTILAEGEPVKNP